MKVLRQAGRADLDRVIRLERACFRPEDGIFSRRQWRALLSNPRAHCLLHEDYLALACWLESNNGRARWTRLYSLAVHPDARGQGWGDRLLEAGYAWMRDQGIAVCRAEVKAENVAARRLYARHGFVECATLPNYYGPGSDGIKLTRDLGSAHPVMPQLAIERSLTHA